MTHDNTVSVIFSFLLFLKPFLPNLHSSSSLGFCFSFSHYAFKMITIEKLRSQDFLSGGTSSTFIHFIGTTHYSSFFFPLGFKCRRWFQPPSNYRLHVCISACLDQRYFYSINHCPHRFIDDTFKEMETH